MNILDEIQSNVLDIEEFSYFNDFELLSSILLAWKKKADYTKISEKNRIELDHSINALTKIGIYVSTMQNRQRTYNIQLSRFRLTKLEAEKKLEDLKQEITDSKIKI